MKINSDQWIKSGSPEIKIFLDDVAQDSCIEADDSAGYVVVNKRNEHGDYVIWCGEIQTEKLTGNVRIECDDWLREKFTGHCLVIIESPFAGDVEKNTRYARACVRDSLLRGEAPIASHLLYTQEGILNDDVPAERQHGIDAGLAWRTVAQASVVYTDLGISKGMEYGIKAAQDAGVPVEYRTLTDW